MQANDISGRSNTRLLARKSIGTTVHKKNCCAMNFRTKKVEAFWKVGFDAGIVWGGNKRINNGCALSEPCPLKGLKLTRSNLKTFCWYD